MGTWERRAPLTAIIAVVLIAVAFAIGGETPDVDASPDETLSYYADHEGAQFAGAILLFYASVLLVFFSGLLRNRLRAPGAATDALATTAMVGGVLQALGIAIFGGLTLTLADASDNLDPVAAQALNALNSDLFFPLALGTAVLLLASGIAILRGAGAGLPRWLGWAGVVLGIVACTPAGFFAFLASGIWLVIPAIMLRRGPRPEAAPAA
jgi:hypothetical protein